MNWRKLICWWFGHDVRRVKYVVKDAKKYHGHDEVRVFSKCFKCGQGTKDKEMWTYQAGMTFMERNEWIIPWSIGIASVIFILAFIFVPTLYFAKVGCLDAGVQMDIPAKYSIWSGCFYEIDGRWIANKMLSVVDLLK
jgi:hypothetical protein